MLTIFSISSNSVFVFFIKPKISLVVVLLRGVYNRIDVVVTSLSNDPCVTLVEHVCKGDKSISFIQ